MGFWDRVDELVNQSLSSSREVLRQAKEKAKDLGEKGLLRYEIGQLERQAKERFAQLGRRVYEALAEKGHATVGRQAVQDLLEEIRQLEETVDKKERELKDIGS